MASKTWNVNLLCLDLTDNFTVTLFATSASLNAVESLRGPGVVTVLGDIATQDRDAITQSLYTPTEILHVMSHANSSGLAMGEQKVLKVFTRREHFYPEDLTAFIDEFEEYPEVECILFDACETASPDWLAKLRRVVPSGQTMTLLGTTREVGINETLIYSLAFYQFLLAKPKGRTRELRFAQYHAAHEFATKAFKSGTRKKCPFVLKIIKGVKIK